MLLINIFIPAFRAEPLMAEWNCRFCKERRRLGSPVEPRLGLGRLLVKSLHGGDRAVQNRPRDAVVDDLEEAVFKGGAAHVVDDGGAPMGIGAREVDDRRGRVAGFRVRFEAR